MVPRRWWVAGALVGGALAAAGGHAVVTAVTVVARTEDLRRGGADHSLLDQLTLAHGWLFLDAGLLFTLGLVVLIWLLATVGRQGEGIGVEPPAASSADDLTSLPNRQDFHAALRTALTRAKSSQGRGLTILAVSLTGVPEVIRAHGALAFDQLLLAASRRLRRVIRDDDEVARIGDQDFGVLLNEITDLRGVEAVTDRIEESFGRPFRLQTGVASVRANVGIAVCGPDVDAEQALLRAESAMYRAAAAGGGAALADSGTGPTGPSQPAVATAAHRPTYQVTLPPEISGDLRSLLRGSDEDHRLIFEYEPVVQLADVAVTGVAASVSWHHPVHGLIPRQELYTIAETSALVTPLMGHLMTQAASHARQWHAAGTPLVVSLPLTAACLSDPWFVPAVQEAVERAGLEAHLLRLEFSESGVLAEPLLTTPALAAIRRLGVGIAVAGFGATPVSLAQLGRVPADEFKIDCRALSDPARASAWDLVREAVGAAHSLGVAAVGSAVSDPTALGTATDAGFDRLHGPVFGQPAPPQHVLLACEHAFEVVGRDQKATPRHGRPEEPDRR